MHSLLCALCYAIFAMRSLLCTLCFALFACTLCYALFAMHPLLCTLCFALFAMHSLQCILCNALFAMHSLLRDYHEATTCRINNSARRNATSCRMIGAACRNATRRALMSHYWTQRNATCRNATQRAATQLDATQRDAAASRVIGEHSVLLLGDAASCRILLGKSRQVGRRHATAENPGRQGQFYWKISKNPSAAKDLFGRDT
jgi:hypothetical protein